MSKTAYNFKSVPIVDMASIAPIDIPRLKSASESLNFSGRKEPNSRVIYQRLLSTKPLKVI